MRDKIKKLPVWAQDYIKNIEREREIAVRALNEHLDRETPSPFRIQEIVSTGEVPGPSFKTRYIQGHRMEIVWLGIETNIILRDKSIDISYTQEGHMVGDVIMQPSSFQQFHLMPVPVADKP